MEYSLRLTADRRLLGRGGAPRGTAGGREGDFTPDTGSSRRRYCGVGAVACIVIGRRKGYRPCFPTITMTVTGSAMLGVGWFGFNGGSALAANGIVLHDEAGDRY